MSEPHLLVVLPRRANHLIDAVIGAGGTPVIDRTAAEGDVPAGAWVRVRPGQPVPGDGPVLLAGAGEPVPGRPTWLERCVTGPVPAGFAGVLLRGREAGGPCGSRDGLELLAEQGGGALLDAGLGPDTAAAAMALGAAGVVLNEQLWALPELGLGPKALEMVRSFGDTSGVCVAGFRSASSPLSAAVREVLAGQDPWLLVPGWMERDELSRRLVPAGQGLALAAPLAARYGSLVEVVRAYRAAMGGWRARALAATVAAPGAQRGSSLALLRTRSGHAVTAEAGGAVGSGVLWQEAAWEGAGIAGGPLAAAMAVGVPVVATAEAVGAARAGLGLVAPEPPKPVVAATPIAEATPVEAPVALVKPAAPPKPAVARPARPSARSVRPTVAIVGLGCCLPDALSIGDFWQNILSGRDSIREIPGDRWPWTLYFDPDRSAPDKTYSRIGGFVTAFHFNPKEFRIPPKVAQALDAVQKMALHAVAAALIDARVRADSAIDRSRVAVILGNSMGGELRDQYTVRTYFPAIVRALTTVPELAGLSEQTWHDLSEHFEQQLKSTLAPITEDSMPGELSNVIAGRIANAFDLGGPNFITDAACASSMAAIQAAVKGLQDGDFDLAISGGSDRSMDIPTYVKFCKIGALSPDHSAPFDASANGFVMGEGAGILVLKRLADAERDGDRVYAVIRGVGASSDGKGKGITAPNVEGQKRALRRAYDEAGIDPVEVDLMECHGTSTVVGDRTEVEALTEVIGAGRRGERGPIRIGSVKSQIGHLKSAAGAAAMIKATLALHHKVLPPSINFRQRREGVDMDAVPLQVQVAPEPWASAGKRRAGVSAFGFGGTNFHLVLEEYTGPEPEIQPEIEPVEVRVERAPVAPRVEGVERLLPQGIWAISASDLGQLSREIDALNRGEARPWNPARPLRLAAAADTVEERREQLAQVQKVMEKGRSYELLRMRGIHLEDVPCNGKLAFLFTGQGSQYIGMGLDLAEAFPVVRATFDEADAVLRDELQHPLSHYIAGRVLPTPAESDEALRATEISQPATLTMDVSILRLLASYGVVPDMVAGHSLGEYGALVAAGIMDFPSALRAVSARGREMAGVRIDDPGKMASIAAPQNAVEQVLAEIPGYVVAANKNAPNQVVIAGASAAVEAACEAFRSRGVTVVPLPVSHAFHSAIVAPATAPLRRVLARLGVSPPRRPVTCNVTSGWYPNDPEAILDLLGKQVAAPVEWVDQMERMYASGATIFVECGPKRALSGFTASIFKNRPHRSLYTNHPKVGGPRAIRDALAGLLALGFPVRSQASEGLPDIFAPMAKRMATSEALARGDDKPLTPTPFVTQTVVRILSERLGMPADSLDPNLDLEADLGVDTVRQAELVAQIREHFQLPREPGFLLSEHRTVRSISDYFAARLGQLEPAWDRRPATAAVVAPTLTEAAVRGFLTHAASSGMKELDAARFAQSMLPAVQSLLSASWEAFRSAQTTVPAPVPVPVPAPVPTTVPVSATLAPSSPAVATARSTRIVCTGVSLGLPGGSEIFSDDNVQSLLNGDNRIGTIPEAQRARFLEKHIVRLVKGDDGQGSFLPVTEDEQVIHLAGLPARFDLVADYGVSEEWHKALDRTTELAFAAGVEALRDAGIPLVRTWRATSTGRKVPTGWALPESLRDGTGIVFASAFPGYHQLITKLQNGGVDEEGHFDRRFLFQILAMGHSQFAQFVGARGPNTQVNAACSSTTLAIAIAEDWMKLGRAERVIVLGVDDVTNDVLLEWIGAGFMAAGAATTARRVEDGALPFDRRRHGMILGMGAVGLVLEKAEDAAARGLVPIAELLATRIANSAFHGTRLDAEHIAREFTAFVGDAAKAAGVRPVEMASRSVFLSHETYTPARGGSAGAEIAALRSAFGAQADSVIIANTKGYTGHAMGAGIEDALAVKVLQYRKVPPIPNFKEPDPELGNLRLSKGGPVDVDFALRLSAGFGSQLAFAAWKAVARGDARVADAAAQSAWLRRVSGFTSPSVVVEQRTLRVVEGAEASEPAPVPVPVPTPTAPTPTAGPSAEAVLDALLTVVQAKTGYAREDLDPDSELEADLGIDTVKQAEIFTEVRKQFGVERDEGFSLADYPTIAALAGWLSGKVGSSPTDLLATPPAPAPTPEPVAPPVNTPTDLLAPSETALIEALLEVIAARTGYGREDLDLDSELEADLGIDTVKQAEIFTEVRKRFGVERDEGFSLADYPTIRALAGWLTAAAEAAASPVPAPVRKTVPVPAVPAVPAAPVPVPETVPEPVVSAPTPKAANSIDPEAVLERLYVVVGNHTGYGRDDLDPDMELEADLGIDTVKQAEIFTEVRQHFGVDRDDSFTLAEHRTIRRLGEWLTGRIAQRLASAVEDAADPLSEPVGDPASDLPATFRVRRPVQIPRPRTVEGSLRGRIVRLLGEGPVADALQRELKRMGAQLGAEGADAVIDVSADVLETFEVARALVPKPPRDWICLTILGEEEGISPDQAFFDGSRSGFTKALGREWADCAARVVDVTPACDPDRIAALICAELAAPDGATEILYDADERRSVIELALEPHPPALARPPAGQVVIVTGGGRGITAQVVLEMAKRSPGVYVLVGRSPAGAAPLNEDAARAQIRAELTAEGAKVTPVRIEQRLAPLRSAEEIRRTVESIGNTGSKVVYRVVDMADRSEVRGMVRGVMEAFGRVDGCIHGAGVEESRLLQDKDLRAFHRVFDGKAVGGLTLAETLPPAAWLLSMGSVAGRFGNAGQVDYCAANEAMAQICRARPRSLHVDWTAWADVGMAVRGGMQTLLESKGVELMPAPAGAALAVDLVAAGVEGEVVVAGRLGSFVPKPNHPLLSSVEHEGEVIIARYTLDIDSSPWVLDHAIDQVPVLPGVIGIELMAAAAVQARPGLPYVGVEHVRFDRPVKLYRNDPVDLEIRAVPLTEGRVRCTLSSERRSRTGKRLRSQHFEAVVLFGAPSPIDELPPAFFPDESINRMAIYRRFFHGPAFQVLRGADAVTRDGVLATGRVEHAFIAEGLLTSPLAVEAALQAAGLHAMAVQGRLALPASIEALHLVRPVRDGEDLVITAWLRGDAYDVDVDGEAGRVLCLRGFRLVERGPLPEKDRFPVPSEGWVEEAFSTSGLPSIGNGGVSAIVGWARVDEGAAGLLNAAELAELRGRGNEKRVSERVAGRVAAKRAIGQLTGRPPEVIRIRSLESGQPVAEVDGQPGPALSISHSRGRAVAVVVATGRVGVDLEEVRARGPDFTEDWFDPEERAFVGADPFLQTVAWAAKEAVLKALGAGMKLNPREVLLTGVYGDVASVRAKGGVAEHLRALGLGALELAVTRDGDTVVVSACLAA